MWLLIRRAMCSQTLATLFYWCLVAETADGEKGPLFERARQHLLKAMEDSSEGQAIRNMLDSQVALRHKLLWCVQSAKANTHFRFEHMTQYFRDELSQEQPALDDGRPLCPLNIVEGLDTAIPLPMDPRVSLSRIIADESSLLKSAMEPAVLQCQVSVTGANGLVERRHKQIMMKEGDDLRQDQLVLQLIVVMDNILKQTWHRHGTHDLPGDCHVHKRWFH